MEKHLAYAYNVDYWDGKSQLNLAPEMLQLRYANYPKDYFMGMLPSSQYGSVATLKSNFSEFDSNLILSSRSGSTSPVVNPASGNSVVTQKSNSLSAPRYLYVNTYHLSSMGNGNFGGEAGTLAVRNVLRDAFKKMCVS